MEETALRRLRNNNMTHVKLRQTVVGTGGGWLNGQKLHLVARRRYQLTAVHVEMCGFRHPVHNRHARIAVQTPASPVGDCSNNGNNCGNDRYPAARLYRPMLATPFAPDPIIAQGANKSSSSSSSPPSTTPTTLAAPTAAAALGGALKIQRDPEGIACPRLTFEWRGCGNADNEGHDKTNTAADIETGSVGDSTSTQACGEFCVGKGYAHFVLVATYPYSGKKCYCRADDSLFSAYTNDPAQCGPPCDNEWELTPTRFCGSSRKIAAYRDLDPKGNSQV